jgi:hypothetical protein
MAPAGPPGPWAALAVGGELVPAPDGAAPSPGWPARSPAGAPPAPGSPAHCPARRAPAAGWPARSPGASAPGRPPACSAGWPFPRPGDPATARPGAAGRAPAWRRLARHWPPRAGRLWRARAGRPQAGRARAWRQCLGACCSRPSPHPVRMPGAQAGRRRPPLLMPLFPPGRAQHGCGPGRPLTAPAVLTARFRAVVLHLANAAGEAGRRCPVPRPTPLAARRRKCSMNRGAQNGP